ncbi:MAG: histidine phosphatase family protein, partial [Pseudomonadota bacterium]
QIIIMTKRFELLLFRHAKSAWDNPELTDHDRPLAPRGVRGAKLMGHFIGQHHLWPDLVLCSSATRALDTLEITEHHWGKPKDRVEVTIDRGLYLCGADGFARALRGLSDEHRRVMIIAHNPDLHDLALSLLPSDQQAEPKMRKMRAKFPTAALTSASLSINSWREFQPDGAARITLFETPKTLADHS